MQNLSGPFTIFGTTFSRRARHFRRLLMNTEAHLRPRSLLTPLFGQIIRYAIAPLGLGFSGFHITDFLLSGVYSWPRTSRIIVIILAVVILSYEFVYKETIAQMPPGSNKVGLKAVLSSCVVPFMLGSCVLVFLIALSQ